MIIEKYSRVQRIVSSVEGELRPGMTHYDVLRATFPAGTLSGAPKVRAMQLIDELEPVKRGLYGGAVGYLSFSGEMVSPSRSAPDSSTRAVLYVQAGAGIVADWCRNPNGGRPRTRRALCCAPSRRQEGLDIDF